MTWVKVDDHFDEHPKLAQVGPLGWGIWLAGLAYSNRNLTDGFIPRAVALSLGHFELIGPDDKLYTLGASCGMTGEDLDAKWVIDFLLFAGLWEPVPGGYRIHDYEDYQPSKERVLTERNGAAKRQQKSRSQRESQRDMSVSHTVSHSDPVPVPVPTASSSLRSEVVECFKYWQEHCNHHAAKLTADRRSKIEARLRDGYTVDDIRKGVDGAARSPFINEAGKCFDDIELICRSGAKLEDFIGRATAVALRAVPNGKESPSDIWRALNPQIGEAR